jgi:hypothetical protein
LAIINRTQTLNSFCICLQTGIFIIDSIRCVRSMFSDNPIGRIEKKNQRCQFWSRSLWKFIHILHRTYNLQAYKSHPRIHLRFSAGVGVIPTPMKKKKNNTLSFPEKFRPYTTWNEKTFGKTGGMLNGYPSFIGYNRTFFCVPTMNGIVIKIINFDLKDGNKNCNATRVFLRSIASRFVSRYGVRNNAHVVCAWATMLIIIIINIVTILSSPEGFLNRSPPTVYRP